MLVLAALQDLENELVALFAVLAEKRLDILERGSLERLETISLVHVSNDTDDVFPPAYLIREIVARATRRLGAIGSQVDTDT